MKNYKQIICAKKTTMSIVVLRIEQIVA